MEIEDELKRSEEALAQDTVYIHPGCNDQIYFKDYSINIDR
jgi:hypothetical protein